VLDLVEAAARGLLQHLRAESRRSTLSSPQPPGP
jgi:hypothetical protein